MTDQPGPWDPPPGDPPPAPRSQRMNGGFLLWLALVASLLLGLWYLPELLPGRELATGDYVQIVGLILIVALVTRGLLAASRTALLRGARDILAWLGIALLLALAFVYRDEFRPMGARLLSALVPGTAVSLDAGSLVLTVGRDGHFHIMGTVNGTKVTFLVDTGASDIVLSPADAARAGIDVGSLQFSRVYETANGLGRGAPVILSSLEVGPLRQEAVRATVNQAAMRQSLLGMAFFRNVASFEVRGGTMTIRLR